MATTSRQHVQVLHVDDDPNFSDLVQTFLEREDGGLTVETATSADEGLAVIDDRPPDCVVSDYNMPGMDGIEFLEVVREEHPDLPFILYTGKGSEAVASEAIAGDVTDYLQKGSGSEQYELLANRIRNAVRARRESKRADRQDQLMRLTEFAGGTGGFELDTETGEMLLTEGIRQLVGLSAGAELSLTEAIDLYHPEDRAEIRQTIDRARRTGEQTHGTWRLQAQEGTERIVDVTFTPASTDGDTAILRGAIHDITDRRDRQRELQQNRELLSNIEELADAGAWEYDSGTEQLMITDGTRQLYGLDPGAGLSLDEALDAVHPDDRDGLADRLSTCVETGEPYQTDLRLTTPDGGQRWLTARGERVNDGASGSVVRGYIQDVTDQKQRERELRQERDLVTGIVETVPVGISVHETDGSISFLNEQMESISGRSLEDVEGIPYDDSQYDLVDEHGEPLGSGEAPLDNVVSRETVVDNQVVGTRRPSGERVWLSVSGSPQYTDDGELERTVFAVEDITEQRELEAELSEILGRISDAFFALDEEFRFTHLNARGEELLETPEHELLGETLWDMYPELGDSDEIWDSFHAAMDTQESHRLEFYSSGENWYEMSVHPSSSGVSVYFQDVTDRKNSEQELQAVKRQYETLAEHFPNGAVYLIDTDLRCARAGGEELSRVGLSPDDAEGSKPHALFPEAIASELCHYFEEALDGNANTFEQEYEGGRYRNQTVPVRTDDGEITYAIAVSQNITERAADARELARQNERLEEFASIVSHDLRNPLQVADGRVALLREECESDHVDGISRALDRMDALIEDLLTLAREGKQVAETEPVGLATVAEDSWQTVNTEQAALETDISRAVRADQSRLRQLFENLYRNAVEHGGDDVTVSVGAIGGGFYVADTGPGIPESDREDVFEAGYSTNEAGTGFGLRIVEQVADAHGWDVAVTESEQGGARFEVTGVEPSGC